jgi:hypothetical protein
MCHQRLATMAVTLPLAVAAEATLVAARQLPNNHPPLHASSSAMEQWHHDADQLIFAANNTPPHGEQ